MTMTKLLAYDSAIKGKFKISVANSSTYCILSEVGGKKYYKNGPGGAIGTAAC